MGHGNGLTQERSSKIRGSCAVVFSHRNQKLSYFVFMLARLKLDRIYDGFLFLAEAARNPPILKSHHHVELELNLVVRGSITYVVDGKRFTFTGRTLLWMFPSQE